jgi:predicted MPP superfamily phosphohydrolase
VPNLGESCDAFTHLLSLELAVKDVLDCNGLCGSGINEALIILDRNKHTLLVKHRPMIMDNLIKFLLEG